MSRLCGGTLRLVIIHFLDIFKAPDKPPTDIFAFGFSVRTAGLRRLPDVGQSFLGSVRRRLHMIANRLAILAIVRGDSPPHKREVYLKIKWRFWL